MRDTRQAETLRRVLESFALDLHVALPGKIRSYDTAAQTAEIEIQVRRVIPAAEDTDADAVEAYPILPSVPVLWPRGQRGYLHIPLRAGDGVLVVFSEADLGQWRATGEVSDPGLSTRHGLSGGVAIPGLHWQGNPNADASSEVGGWRLGREGGAYIEGTADTIAVGGQNFLAEASPVQAQLDAIAADLATIAARFNAAAGPMLSAPGTIALTTPAAQAANPIATTVTRGT